MIATAMIHAVVVEKDTARSTASLPRRVLIASHSWDWKRVLCGMRMTEGTRKSMICAVRYTTAY